MREHEGAARKQQGKRSVPASHSSAIVARLEGCLACLERGLSLFTINEITRVDMGEAFVFLTCEFRRCIILARNLHPKP